ncbi:hypothetical protein H2201_009247, partial [Coniosporium apollinis]
MASNTVPSASSSTQDDSDIITTNSDTLSSVPSDLSDEDALQPAPSKKRPRKAKATKTWSYARAPTGSEPVRDDKKRRIWYCQWAQCKDYSATITSNIRYHMKNKHGVDIEEEVSLVKKATHARLESLFEKQEQQANMRADQKKEAILKSVVNKAKYGKNPRLLSSIRTGWYAFDKWYKKTDAVAAYAAALLLHPARRKAYINRQWLQKWRTPAIKRVEDLWKKEYMHKAPPSRTALSDKQPIQEPDEYDRWNRQNNALLAVKDEFNDFIDDRP